MGPLQKLETKLDEVFRKNAPPLPENSRKSLAGVMWIIALVFGIVQLYAAWRLWRLGEMANELVNWSNSLSRAYGDGAVVDGLGPMFYLSMLVLVADALILLVAVPGLRAFNKVKGWNLLYYGLLLNVLYSALRIFSDVGGGFMVLIWSLFWFAIGAYLLFQIREYFNGVRPIGPSRPRAPKMTEKTTDTAPPAEESAKKEG